MRYYCPHDIYLVVKADVLPHALLLLNRNATSHRFYCGQMTFEQILIFQRFYHTDIRIPQKFQYNFLNYSFCQKQSPLLCEFYSQNDTSVS